MNVCAQVTRIEKKNKDLCLMHNYHHTGLLDNYHLLKNK
jgi:hypothetical protein